MGCEVHRFPVTGLLSDHPFHVMNTGDESASQRRRQETVAVRSAMSSREPSREDLELAKQLVGQSQGRRSPPSHRSESNMDSPSPREFQGSESLSSAGQEASNAEQYEREGSQSYAPPLPASENVPSGQVCRYYHLQLAPE